MATTRLRPVGAGSATAVVSLLAATSLAFAGCSGAGAAPSAGMPTPGAALGGELNILVSSAAGSDAGFEAINAAFAKKYPGVKVNFTSVPNENYNQTRTSRLTAGSIDIGLANPQQLPDYVPASNMGDDARLADAGGFVDLTSQPFMARFIPSVLEKITYKGKNYTVPTGLSYYSGMTYNKKIFTDNNIQIPTTWDEFVKVCQDLKAKGITPISIGGKDTAGIVMLAVAQSLYPTVQDKQALAKGLYDYSIKLNEGKQLDVLQKTEQIYTFAQDNFAGSNYSQMTSE
ncbi:MAG: extracellular solute-binding protein [Actinobacteria bacterium]|nr:extracellular solute-binding protein [Actinomycetota bacterium]